MAQTLGIRVRQEFLDGAGGGHCIVAAGKLLLLDVTQPTEEQLRDVADALRTETQLWKHDISPQLAQRLQLTEAA
ncbi:MAG: hypothetical protein CMJ58_11065 [Planctomycetaceae bacterium]|nr:hypothetical protein [Planctomycetaceae bacterium]